jgi:isoleucyl-tRNA synthetase
MSRKKNYPDPTILIEKYSADALRFYLMSQPLVNGENLAFNEAGVDEVAKKFITIMKNVVSFYGLYKEHDDGREPSNTHVLDQWITARLQETLVSETAAIERYDLSDASRALQAFVTDLSTWYVRRSRDRVKEAGRIVPHFNFTLTLVTSPNAHRHAIPGRDDLSRRHWCCRIRFRSPSVQPRLRTPTADCLPRPMTKPEPSFRDGSS